MWRASVQLQACESWDLRLRELPERTYFYHLQPLGVGSACVESLTGYIARLADAHNVSTGVLLSRELLPRIRAASPTPIATTSSTFVYDAQVLNGTGETSRNWVQLLQRMTGIGSLDRLTLLPWRQVISHQSLFRRTRAWCPSCYSDWTRSSLPIYEPLLWTIGTVSHCPVHRRALKEQCPYCQRTLHPLSARFRPGYCCLCQGWLGDEVASPGSTNEAAHGVARAEGIGELLSAAPQMTCPPHSGYLKHNLQLCIDELAAGSKSRFCRMTGISFDSLSYCLSESGRIRVDALVSVCAQAGVSPLLLLSEYVPTGTFEGVRERAARGDPRKESGGTEAQPRVGVPESVSKPALSPPPSSKVTKAALRRALNESAPVTVRTVARQLGYAYESTVYRRFPELSRALAIKNARFKQQRAERLSATFAAALQESPPPTIPEIARRLRWSVEALRYRFPEFCAALVSRLPERKLFFNEQVRSMLSHALSEEPAPSMKTVAQKVGRSVDHLRTTHADLCRAITARYMEHKTVQADRRRMEFQEQIQRAIIQLCERGVFPSRQRVLASIPNPVMKSTFVLDRQIAMAVGNLQR
jgi:hypothetical protein